METYGMFKSFNTVRKDFQLVFTNVVSSQFYLFHISNQSNNMFHHSHVRGIPVETEKIQLRRNVALGSSTCSIAQKREILEVLFFLSQEHENTSHPTSTGNSKHFLNLRSSLTIKKYHFYESLFMSFHEFCCEKKWKPLSKNLSVFIWKPFRKCCLSGNEWYVQLEM